MTGDREPVNMQQPRQQSRLLYITCMMMMTSRGIGLVQPHVQPAVSRPITG